MCWWPMFGRIHAGSPERLQLRKCVRWLQDSKVSKPKVLFFFALQSACSSFWYVSGPGLLTMHCTTYLHYFATSTSTTQDLPGCASLRDDGICMALSFSWCMGYQWQCNQLPKQEQQFWMSASAATISKLSWRATLCIQLVLVSLYWQESFSLQKTFEFVIWVVSPISTLWPRQLLRKKTWASKAR